MVPPRLFNGGVAGIIADWVLKKSPATLASAVEKLIFHVYELPLLAGAAVSVLLSRVVAQSARTNGR